MGGKPREKPLRPAAEYKAMAERLAGCVVFALKFLNTKGGGGLMFNPTTGALGGSWQDDFMDALDGCGIVTDRKAYWAMTEKKRRRR